MMAGFFLRWSRGSKIIQNVIFHVKLQALTLNKYYQWTRFANGFCGYYVLNDDKTERTEPNCSVNNAK